MDHATFSPVTAAAFRRAMIAGARRVIEARDELNRINVFPVPDGDTGSNLASTLGNVLQGALSRRSHHIGELLVGIGNDAIDGARGNSGAIMAQCLVGLAEQSSVVVDPFLGAGSTGVACLLTGRKFIGFDIDSKHVDTARGRLSAAVAKLGAA